MSKKFLLLMGLSVLFSTYNSNVNAATATDPNGIVFDEPDSDDKNPIADAVGQASGAVVQATDFVGKALIDLREQILPSANTDVAPINNNQEEIKVVVNEAPVELLDQFIPANELVEVVIKEENSIPTNNQEEVNVVVNEAPVMPAYNFVEVALQDKVSAQTNSQEEIKVAVNEVTIQDKSDAVVLPNSKIEVASAQTDGETAQITITQKNDEAAVVEEKTVSEQQKMTFFGVTLDRQTLMYFGAGAIALITIGGITYVLYQNGTLKKVGKDLQKFVHDHKVGVATAVTATVALIIAGICAKQYGITPEKAYGMVAGLFQKQPSDPVVPSSSSAAVVLPAN